MSRKSVAMAIVILLWSSFAYAGDNDLSFLKGYDSIIQKLNNYTVTFAEPGKTTRLIAGSNGVDKEGMKITYTRVKKKKKG